MRNAIDILVSGRSAVSRNTPVAVTVGLVLALAMLAAPVASHATRVDRTVFSEEFGFRT